MLILSLLLLALVAFKLYGYLFIGGRPTKGVFDLQFDKRRTQIYLKINEWKMCRYTTAHSQNILHGFLLDGGFLVFNATFNNQFYW